MNLIVAADKNWGIGKDNKLLVSIPSDMKFFRQETMGKVVVMGRKTLESFPNGLPLKNRTNVVLTSDKNYQVKDAVIVHSIDEVLEELKKKYTVVVVTHNMQQAARVSDYTAFFLVGEMVEFDTTDNIFSRPKDKRTEDYITGRFG